MDHQCPVLVQHSAVGAHLALQIEEEDGGRHDEGRRGIISEEKEAKVAVGREALVASSHALGSV